MTKEHTPGPWHADETDVSDKYRYVFAHYGLICRVTLLDEHSEADAHLIAAAPDLLAACRALLDALPSATTYPAIAQARAAIKSATGQ